MPVYMRVEKSPGTVDPDISGDVTTAGYGEWIAIESYELTLAREEHGGDGTAPAPTAAAGGGTQSSRDAVQRRLDAASRVSRGDEKSKRRRALVRPVKLYKRPDNASSGLLQWAAVSRGTADRAGVTRDLVLHVVSEAAADSGKPEPELVVELRRCTPESVSIDLDESEEGGIEQLVVRPEHLHIRHVEMLAGGKRGEATEFDFRTDEGAT